MKKNFMVRSPTDSDFHTFNRPGISLLQAAVISRKERHATSDTIVCKFADASVWRFLQCINDEAVSYACIDIKRLPYKIRPVLAVYLKGFLTTLV